MNATKKPKAGLYLVSLPIGNLGDMSFRAIQTLKSADEIWAEDTRNLRKILTYFDIPKAGKNLIACHDHNEREMAPRLIEAIKSGKTIAYTSDAGMPLISDPGFNLVKAMQEAELYYTIIPGPSAVLSAMALSAMPSDKFAFLGFIPNKEGKRKKFFEEIKSLQMSAIAFESPKRLQSSLQSAREVLGDHAEIALIREITKTYEEVIRNTLAKLISDLANHTIKGEIVLVFAPLAKENASPSEIEESLRQHLKDMRVKDASKRVAEQFGLSRNEVYRMALELINQEE